MTLAKLLNPHTIAVIGASNRIDSVGEQTLFNLLNSHYSGKCYPINPKYKKIKGLTCLNSIKECVSVIDFAIIATPAHTVADVLTECGEMGVSLVLIISSGMGERNASGKALEQSLLLIAKRFSMRLMGPNCVGFMKPGSHLNASFMGDMAKSGPIAFVSQSGAICASVLSQGVNTSLGFSWLMSLGNCLDISMGEILEFLALDKKTQCIVLYCEGIKDGASFIKGLTSAALLKPVIILKSGRFQAGSHAALSHTGAIINDDAVFDAVVHQCGALRITSMQQLFNALTLFSFSHRAKGNRLTIITNGGGAGVLAADKAAELALFVKPLSKLGRLTLKELCPDLTHFNNPLDLSGDATAERLKMVLETCITHEKTDAIIVLWVPLPVSNPHEIRKVLLNGEKLANKPLLIAWLGNTAPRLKHNPVFTTPEDVIEAYDYLVQFHGSRSILKKRNEHEKSNIPINFSEIYELIDTVVAEKRTVLSALEAKKLLKQFSIPVNMPFLARTLEEAIDYAQKHSFPLAMKIQAPSITHKKDVGGVQLNLQSIDDVSNAFNHIIANVKKAYSDMVIHGVTLEPMIKAQDDRELIIGVITDNVFGPVVSFGAGGTFVELWQDRALALLPINRFTANQLIGECKISKALNNFRGMKPIDHEELINILMKVSLLTQQLPFIQAIDINPFIANSSAVIAVDARIIIDPEKYRHA